MQRAPRVLVVRNDKLGDFLVSLPAFALLKRSLPDAESIAFVSERVLEAARMCPWIDRIETDAGPREGLAGTAELARRFRSLEPDALVALVSTTRIGLAGLRARVPYRLAPATKLAQLFYTRRLVQRRRHSNVPESEHGLALVRCFLADRGIEPALDPRPPFLEVDAQAARRRERALRAQHRFDERARLVLLHPGSGGSSPKLSPERYAELARALGSRGDCALVVTAGPGELPLARRVARDLGGLPHAVHESTDGLLAFAELVSRAELFVGGSTGALHLAGALDVPTAAFYSRRASASAARWRTLNSQERRLAFSPPPEREEGDLDSIDLAEAARRIRARFLAPRGD